MRIYCQKIYYETTGNVLFHVLHSYVYTFILEAFNAGTHSNKPIDSKSPGVLAYIYP